MEDMKPHLESISEETMELIEARVAPEHRHASRFASGGRNSDNAETY